MVREATIALFRSFAESAWSERGTASDCTFTVRALAYVIVGHEVHHRRVLAERYLADA